MLTPDPWPSIETRMRDAGVAELAIAIMAGHFRQLAAGKQSYIREQEIAPIDHLTDFDGLDPELENVGRQAIPRTVVLKLNGGLGTGMGLEGPKSLLPLRDGMTFLDFIVAQTNSLDVPLLLMNSFATAAATEASLQHYREVGVDRFRTFLQHQVPKLLMDDLSAAQCEAQAELAWCPPGHGDLYAALVTSGMLARLLDEGRRWMFISNADNLGATLDLRVLGYMVQQQLAFLMEVADRTPSDRKGGHLAKRSEGTLLLRESAQCHDDDQAAFQDIERHRFFNTNNLWIDLQALARELERHKNMLPLSLIVNRKTLDPLDPASPAVYQLETAMGSAISVLTPSAALRVPRSRFAPVKTCGDLLAVQSDAFEVDLHFAVRLVTDRKGIPPLVSLDDRFYKSIAALQQRFQVCPSLWDCTSLTIKGPFDIRQGVRFRGEVELINRGDEPVALPAGEYTGRHEFPSREVPHSH